MTIVVQGPDDSATASSPAVMVTYGYGKNIIWGNYDGVGQIVLSLINFMPNSITT